MSEYGIIPVDRTKPFNLEAWGQSGWSIAREQPCPELTSFSIRHLHFRPPFWEREDVPKGLARADLHIFEALWKHRLMLTPWYKEKIPSTNSFFQCYCDGVSFLNERGVECVFYLRYGPDHKFEQRYLETLPNCWHWGTAALGKNWGEYFPSIMLPVN